MMILNINKTGVEQIKDKYLLIKVQNQRWRKPGREPTVYVLLPGSHHALCLCIAAWGTASVGFPGRRPQERLGVV